MHSRPSFSLFDSKQMFNINKFLPMTGFEPRTSGIGSDRSTNWATTTSPSFLSLFVCLFIFEFIRLFLFLHACVCQYCPLNHSFCPCLFLFLGVFLLPPNYFFRANPFCLFYFCLDNHLHRKKLKLSSLEIKAKTLTKRRFHPFSSNLSNSFVVKLNFCFNILLRFFSLFFSLLWTNYISLCHTFQLISYQKGLFTLSFSFFFLSLSLSLTHSLETLS